MLTVKELAALVLTGLTLWGFWKLGRASRPSPNPAWLEDLERIIATVEKVRRVFETGDSRGSKLSVLKDARENTAKS
jgi:hypothetical protein